MNVRFEQGGGWFPMRARVANLITEAGAGACRKDELQLSQRIPIVSMKPTGVEQLLDTRGKRMPVRLIGQKLIHLVHR